MMLFLNSFFMNWWYKLTKSRNVWIFFIILNCDQSWMIYTQFFFIEISFFSILYSRKNNSFLSWQRDSSVRDVDYEPFDSILCSNRSQKSQEISIRRNSNDVRMLREQKSWSCRVFTYATTFLLTVTIDLRGWLMTCRCQ